MAGEILVGKTILEALNTDLVCDAINTAMRELFLQIVYGRTQSAFSEGGLQIGAGLEDLGKGHRSQVGTIFSTKEKGPRYLELTEGYITEIGLDEDDEIIGYKYINLGVMLDAIITTPKTMNITLVNTSVSPEQNQIPRATITIPKIRLTKLIPNFLIFIPL
jgi:hypothetical protein